MNEKELLEIERQAKEEINDRNKVPYNQFAEYCLDFIAEIKRQRDILIQLAGEESLHQDGMYKTEMQKLHETNKRYKQAHELVIKFYKHFDDNTEVDDNLWYEIETYYKELEVNPNE